METEINISEAVLEETEVCDDIVSNDPPTEEMPAEETSDMAPESDYDRLESLKKQERIAEEYKEFSELFPGVSINTLPDSVSDSVRAGVPLAAAYALYHRKKEAAMAVASTVNQKNRERSFAVKKNDSSDSYFSPSEVREMSPAEVKANYSKIIESMSHWH